MDIPWGGIDQIKVKINGGEAQGNFAYRMRMMISYRNKIINWRIDITRIHERDHGYSTGLEMHRNFVHD